MKKKIGIIFLCMLLLLTGCISKESKHNDKDGALLTPNEIIDGFFEAYNEKNLEGMDTFTTEKYHGSESSWQFDNLEYIKVINIVEDTDVEKKQLYYRQGKKNEVINMDEEKAELENISIFKVEFEVKYKKDGVGPQDSGRDIYYYILTRKDKSFPWLISSMGH